MLATTTEPNAESKFKPIAALEARSVVTVESEPDAVLKLILELKFTPKSRRGFSIRALFGTLSTYLSKIQFIAAFGPYVVLLRETQPCCGKSLAKQGCFGSIKSCSHACLRPPLVFHKVIDLLTLASFRASLRVSLRLLR